MKTTAGIFRRLTIAVCGAVLVWGTAVWAADFPRAQLDESERYFTEAYMRFLARDYWGASDYMDRALKANTYLVDYYLLKGLTSNRIGDYSGGREALAYYLEVRPMDSAAPRILSYTIAQQRDLRRILGTTTLSARWRLSRPDFQTEFDLGVLRPFSTSGLGKAEAWGKSLCITDTLGDRVYFKKEGLRGIRQLEVNHPAAAIPMGDHFFYVVTTGGDIYSFGAFSENSEPLSLDIQASLDAIVMDATALSAGEFAIADPVARETGIYSFATFERTGQWSPPEDEEAMLFEPVALSSYGNWLAVADRGNEKIFFLNLLNWREFFSTEVPRPRDIVWSSLGELFVINEEGELFRALVDFRDRRVDAVDLMESGLENGWALFKTAQGDLYCMDIAASQIWKAVLIPDVTTSSGFLSISLPMIERDAGKESFLMEASLMSPFTSYSRTSNPVVYAVWNNKTMVSSAVWQAQPADRKADILFFHRPAPLGTVSPSLKNMVVENGTDIQIVLPSIWTTQKESLTNIVIDSSIIFSQDELDMLTLFCLNNGVELDIWARAVPSVEMTRAAALTGGEVFFSAVNVPDLTPPRNKLQIRVPLPLELSSSGYPGRSMLSVYLDIGLMHTRDWIPLWPDLLE